MELKKIFFKMGVMCGEMLYATYKFDDFEKMMQEAEEIDDKFNSDMMYCSFVFQAFKDESYDFSKSCFFQEIFSVNGISRHKAIIAKAILTAYEKNVGLPHGGEGGE